MKIAATSARVSRRQPVRHHGRAWVLAMAVGSLALAGPAFAADVIKANNNTNLNLGASWVGNVVPTSADVAVFNATLTGPISTLLGDSSQSWAGIRLTNPAGLVTIGADTNTLTLGTEGINLFNATQDLHIDANLSLQSFQTWSIAAGRTIKLSGTVTPLDTLTLRGPGRLVLDFTPAGAPNSNILASNTSLILAGGTTVQLNGGAGETLQQAFGSFNLNGPGKTTLNIAPNGASYEVNLGTLSLTSPGAVMVIHAPEGGNGVQYVPGTGVTNNPTFQGTGAGVQKGAFLTWGLADWAAPNGFGNIDNAGLLGIYNQTPPANNSNTNQNFDVAANYNSGTSTTIVHTIRFNTPGANTWNSRAVLGTGGVLVTPNMGAENVTMSATGAGNLGPGRDDIASEMVIWQNNTSGHLIMTVPLTNPRTGAGNYVFAGISTVQLSGNNVFTGQTYHVGGATVVNANVALGAQGTAATANLAGGALVANPGTTTLNLSNNGANPRPINVTDAGGALAALTGKTLLVPGVVSGTGMLTIGTGQLPGTGDGTANPTPWVGNGTVNFASGDNTLSGGITVANGTFVISNAAGSATGTSNITVNSDAVFGGSGIATGNVTVLSGGQLSPGVAGVNSGVGTVTVGGLTMSNGSIVNVDLSPVSNDLTVITANGLTVGAPVGVNLFAAGTNSPFNIGGTFNIFNVAGGTLPSDATLQANLTIGNPQPGATYTWGHTGSTITLSITGLAALAIWNVNGGGGWEVPGNWSTNSVPNAAGATATFGTVVTTGTATVNLNGNKTVGSIAFNNTNASYVIAQGSGGSLILDAGAGTATVLNGGGTHTISAPVTLNSDLGVTTTLPTDVMTISGNITGAKNVTINGLGTTVLSGNNGHINTIINAGTTLQIGAGGTTGTLGTGSVTLTGTLAINRSDASSITSELSGSGTLVHSGTGTTTLSGVNALTGATSITAGKLVIGTGSTIGTGALNVVGALDLNGANVGTTSLTGSGAIDNSAAGTTSVLTLNGSGNYSGSLMNSGGTLALTAASGSTVLSGNSSFTGATTIVGGAQITVGSNSALGQTSGIGINLGSSATPALVLSNGITLDRTINLSGSTFEFITVPAGASATLSGALNVGDGQMRIATNATGTLTITGNTTVTNNPLVFITGGNVIFAGDSAYTSTVNLGIGRSTTQTHVTFKDNATATMSTLTLAQGGANNPNVSLTIQDNAVVTVGDGGTGGTELRGQSGGTATTNLNLNGGTLATGGFSKATTGATQLAHVNFNGGTLKLPAGTVFGVPANAGADIVLLEGGAKIDLNGSTLDTGFNLPINGTTSGGILLSSTAGGGTLALNSLANYQGPTTVPTGVTFILNTGPHSIGRVNGDGIVQLGSGVTVTSDGVTAASLNIESGASLMIRANGSAQGASKVGVLTIAGSTGAWTGKLDLTDNALILTAADAAAQATLMAQVRNQITSGSAGGTWTGNGITSSSLPTLNGTASSYTLAVADAGDLGATAYRGQTGLDANSTIVVVTRNGDATLDLVVDAFDLNILAANWQTSGRIWSSGDFTGDGTVDAFDLNVLAANWQFGVGGSLQAALAQVGLGSVAAVPEPASLAVLAVGGAALLTRRRRKV